LSPHREVVPDSASRAARSACEVPIELKSEVGGSNNVRICLCFVLLRVCDSRSSALLCKCADVNLGSFVYEAAVKVQHQITTSPHQFHKTSFEVERWCTGLRNREDSYLAFLLSFCIPRKATELEILLLFYSHAERVLGPIMASK
jgi:hypothetical protein